MEKLLRQTTRVIILQKERTTKLVPDADYSSLDTRNNVDKERLPRKKPQSIEGTYEHI